MRHLLEHLELFGLVREVFGMAFHNGREIGGGVELLDDWEGSLGGLTRSEMRRTMGVETRRRERNRNASFHHQYYRIKTG